MILVRDVHCKSGVWWVPAFRAASMSKEDQYISVLHIQIKDNKIHAYICVLLAGFLVTVCCIVGGWW